MTLKLLCTFVVSSSLFLISDAYCKAITDDFSNKNKDSSLISQNPDAAFHYSIRQGDILKIEVFQEDDLCKEVRVGANGTITLPLVGQVNVAGLNIQEAEEQIRNTYASDYLVDPHVNIGVLKYSDRRVNVLGQVNQPGDVFYLPEEKMTLMQAISGAHGLNLRADDKNVQIRRMLADGTTTILRINIKDLLKNPEARDIDVLDGDIIFVPERIF